MAADFPGFGLEPATGPILTLDEVYASPWKGLNLVDRQDERSLSDRPSEMGIAPDWTTTWPNGERGGWFDVDLTNRNIDVDFNGGGEVNLTIPQGRWRATALAAYIQTELQTVDASFQCTYSLSGKFLILANNTFELLWKTGANGSDNLDTSIANEIGFDDAADDTGAGQYFGNEVRASTHSLFIFDAGAGKTFDPGLVAVVLGGDDDTDFSDVKLFLGNTIHPTRGYWVSGAAETVTFSARPTRPGFNALQLAIRTTPTTAYRYLAVSWRHIDKSPEHHIGLLKALDLVRSTTHGVKEQEGHDLDDPSGEGYYASQLQQRWVLPMAIDRWPLTEWDAVIEPVARNGKVKGLVVARDMATLVSGGSSAIQSAADAGTCLWVRASELPKRRTSGGGSDYTSGRFVFRQVP